MADTINEYKKILERIDGKQSISIPVDIKKNGLHVIEPLDIRVRGFLKFEDTEEAQVVIDESQDKTIVHPVLFSSDIVRVNNGRCVIVFIPRSEDLFETTVDIQTRAGEEVITDLKMISQGGVSVDEQITDPDKEPVVIKIETGVTREPYKISLEVTVTSASDTSIYNQTVDRGTNPQIEEVSAAQSLFQKETARISSNLIVSCHSNLEWVPSVKSILGSNDGSRTIMLAEINNLKNFTPLGTSTMYDAVVAGARILSDNSVNNSRKTIYLFTDNEANISVASLDNAIEEVNDIDGDRQVPVLAGNLAISDNATLSIKANRTDTKNINKLSFLTGGQSTTVSDEDFIDEIVGIFYRSAVGSMGYGTYEFIKDFGEEVLINNIFAIFNIPSSDSSATWSIETSLDGYNYTAINIIYNSTDSVDFEDLLVRYIRFKIVLITGISSSFIDEYGTRPDTPSLTSITIIFNANKVAYLYLNKEDVDIPPYQITLAVDANEINDDQIKVGVAKSDSHNWADFSTESQPTVDQNGKVVIPIRFSQDITQFPHEPLKKIDKFATRTDYGKFDEFATVIIYDKNDAVIPSNFYKLYPREGRVVFNNALPSDYQDGNNKIGIINAGEYKVGLQLTNKTETETLDIYGVGHEYTTGKDLLPPVGKSPPEARQVTIVNEAPNRFDIIEASYVYFDSNFEPEETTKRVVRWFINGNPISYLDDKIKWNDINDPTDPVYSNTSLEYPDDTQLAGQTVEVWINQQTDSLIRANDNIYVEIQVSDGDLLSDKEVSPTVVVQESVPVLTGLNVMARDNTGNIIPRLDTSTDAVIYPPLEQSFFTDGIDLNKSEIRWIVNDSIFKQGIFGDPVLEGQPPITEIRVNEIGAGTTIDYGIRIANTIFVEVIPKTDNTTGEIVTSPVVVVQNAIPRVFDLSFVNSVFTPNNDVNLVWDYFDFEGISIRDIDSSGQFDQSEIQWYRQNAGDPTFTKVYSFNDLENNLQEVFFEEAYRGNITTNISFDSRSSIISSNILQEGQKWKAIIIPYDSIDPGEQVESEEITITSATNN